MKKTIIILVCLLVVGLVAIQGVHAESYGVSAAIPAATTVNLITSRVQNGGEFTVIGQGNQAINFTTAGEGIQYDATNGIWAPTRFYAIDVSPQTAGGDPAPASFNQITFGYTEGNNPNGTSDGLGSKGTVTVVRIDTVTDPDDATQLIQVETEVDADTFANAASISVSDSDISGGFMRAYVGVSTGETGKPGAPFTNGDTPGNYSGTLTLSVTLN